MRRIAWALGSALCVGLVAGVAPAQQGPRQGPPRKPQASKGESPKQYYDRRAKELKPDDIWGHLELADICNSAGLPDEAREQAEIVLGLQKRNRLAHEILGHTWHKRRWVPREEAEAEGLVEFHGEWIPKRELPAHEMRRDWDRAWVIERGKTVMRTNTSRRKAEKYFATFLQFKEDMQRNFGMQLNKKYKVNIYAEKDEYHTISGGPPGTGGFYRPSSRDFHFFDDPDFFQARRIFFHEGTHMFVNLTNRNKAFRYPNWLNEGMAEYFGGAKMNYKDGSYTFGHILNDRLDVIQGMIRRNGTTKLKAFMKQEGLGKAYDQGWSIVLFVNNRENGKYKKRFNYFLKALRDHKYANAPGKRGAATVETFKKYYLRRGETLEQFEKAWKAWVLQLKPEPGAPDFRKMKSMH